MTDFTVLARVICLVCDGSGRGRNYDTWDCPQCHGAGHVFVEISLSDALREMQQRERDDEHGEVTP